MTRPTAATKGGPKKGEAMRPKWQSRAGPIGASALFRQAEKEVDWCGGEAPLTSQPRGGVLVWMDGEGQGWGGRPPSMEGQLTSGGS